MSSEELLIKELTGAWIRGKPTYPPKPDKAKLRWFLRTTLSENKGPCAVVIGMNPSTATEFELRRDKGKGDPTTDKVLKRLSLQHLERGPEQTGEPIFNNLVMVNLIPNVGNKNNPPDCVGEDAQLPWEKSIEITKVVWKLVIESATDIILIWGDPEDKNYKVWKPDVIDQLLPFLKSITDDKQIWAVTNAANCAYPYHPGYPHWTKLPLCPVSIDLNEQQTSLVINRLTGRPGLASDCSV